MVGEYEIEVEGWEAEVRYSRGEGRPRVGEEVEVGGAWYVVAAVKNQEIEEEIEGGPSRKGFLPRLILRATS